MMCIILDTNMASDFAQGEAYLAPVAKYLKQGGLVTVNPALIREYPKAILSTLAELGRNNKLRRFEDGDVPAEVSNKLTCDDPHIIDLVMQSRTTVVCTKDKLLTDDLTNPEIISNPRCKVYQHEGAKSILTGCCT